MTLEVGRKGRRRVASRRVYPAFWALTRDCHKLINAGAKVRSFCVYTCILLSFI
jgi:hypothetical protein